jgi:hypothetical protein
MCNITGHTIVEEIVKTKPLTQEELRLKRLAFYDKPKEMEV